MPPELVRRVARPAAQAAGRAVAARWPDHTRLFLLGEGAGWVIDEELKSIAALSEPLGIRLGRPWPLSAARRQAVFYGSHFTLFDAPPDRHGHRIATTYFHGLPGTQGMPEFDRAYDALRHGHERIDRIQVSHRELEDVVLSSGIDPTKVFRIPIAVDLAHFPVQTEESRRAARTRLGIPAGAFVVGSFQKDGVGWSEGGEPKLIKGPDVLVEAMATLQAQVPDLYVLLSGPARGYVKAGLDRHGVRYGHHVLDRYGAVGELYQALDAYVVPARQEGGPKGVLEAMASGVPLVSTRVGQAVDLVRDGENGWLVDVEDAEALAARLAWLSADRQVVAATASAGRRTAEENTYQAQIPLWRSFFDGFVEPA